MKLKHILIAAFFALATAAQAQVKIGSNPTTISPNAVLDVEGSSGSHTVVLQNGNTGVGTVTPGNKVEINQGTAGNSGLRFTQMNNGSAPATTSVANLGVNSSGDVVIAEGAASKQYLTVVRQNSQLRLTTGQDLIFDAVPATNNTIGYDPTTGVATLTVGKTYIISASLHVLRSDSAPLSFGYIQYAFVNGLNNSQLTSWSKAEIIGANFEAASTGSSGTMFLVYKAVDGANTIKLRATLVRNQGTTGAGECSIRTDLFSGYTIVEL